MVWCVNPPCLEALYTKNMDKWAPAPRHRIPTRFLPEPGDHVENGMVILSLMVIIHGNTICYNNGLITMAFFLGEYEILVGGLNPSEKYARQLD